MLSLKFNFFVSNLIKGCFLPYFYTKFNIKLLYKNDSDYYISNLKFSTNIKYLDQLY